MLVSNSINIVKMSNVKLSEYLLFIISLVKIKSTIKMKNNEKIFGQENFNAVPYPISPETKRSPDFYFIDYVENIIPLKGSLLPPPLAEQIIQAEIGEGDLLLVDYDAKKEEIVITPKKGSKTEKKEE